MTTQGLHQNRLMENANNPREVAFASEWEKENVHNEVLEHLFAVPCLHDDPECVNTYSILPMFGYFKLPLGETTQRDRIVAATLIQWLGSNVGLCFIEQSLAKCGYKVVHEMAEYLGKK